MLFGIPRRTAAGSGCLRLPLHHRDPSVVLAGTFVLLSVQHKKRQMGCRQANAALLRRYFMISRCANPACGVPFHYLRHGCLYRFDIKSPAFPCNDVPNAICSLKPSRAVVFFWLCERCSASYSLRFDSRTGVALVPRPSSSDIHDNRACGRSRIEPVTRSDREISKPEAVANTIQEEE